MSESEERTIKNTPRTATAPLPRGGLGILVVMLIIFGGVSVVPGLHNA